MFKEGIPDLQQIAEISSIPLKLLLSPNTRGQAYVANFTIKSLYELQRAISNSVITRTQANVVTKQLPIMLRALLRSQSFVDSQSAVVIAIDQDQLQGVDTIKSAKLRGRLLDLREKPTPVLAKEVYKQPQWQEPVGWQKGIWQIKNPHLRSYRLKILYKDVFSNERRHRFGLTDSPNCAICGQIETVAHQLVECTNARKVWDMYHRLAGRSINELLQVITCTEGIEIEIIKSIVIKHLIQIDRSMNLNLTLLKQEIKRFYNIEANIAPNLSQFWTLQLRHIEQS